MAEMNAPKVTDWLDGGVLPVRVGEYQRDYGNCGGGFAKPIVPIRDTWDGTCWRYQGDLGVGSPCVFQNRKWRGLASDPSATVGKGRP